MKVLNLQCTHQHGFEGWFDSEDDYASQLGRGLLTCPLCGDAEIARMPSAPRLNLRAARGGDTPAPTVENKAPDRQESAAHVPMALQGQMLMALRQVLAQTEDVGEQFPEQARAMHHGDEEARNIRGRASPQEALALLEEGIGVMPLPDLAGIKETLQ